MNKGVATIYSIEPQHLRFAIDRTRPIVKTAMVTVGYFDPRVRIDPITLIAASSYMQGVNDTLTALQQRQVDLSVLNINEENPK